MDYQQTLEYLFSQLPMYQRIGKAAYKADLNNTLALDEHFDHPHKQFKTIHVAGTNGKGSVAHMLTSVLMEAGYSVGLYTSPHLKDFRERIRVNGAMVSEDYVVDFVQKNRKVFEKIKPSFFEMTVAMAFEYFARQNIDIAVIEVGLGGRLDSTNIITPEVSVITNIGLDHTDLLGDTIEKIAWEKAGIIKQGVPVIVGQTQLETKSIFTSRANELDSPISFADSIFQVSEENSEHNQYTQYRIQKQGRIVFESLWVDLKGNYQSLNLGGVFATIDSLNSIGTWEITKKNISDGLANVVKNTGMMGRWQTLAETPLIICDTGHNTDGVTHLINQIAATPHQNLHMIIGVVSDKNVDGILSLLPQSASYYFTKASIPRALDENILAEKATKHGLKGYVYRSVDNALMEAKKNATPNDLIFIGGSTFVVADALDLF